MLLCVIAVLVSSDQGQCQGAGACAGTTSGLKLEPAAAGSSHPSPAPVTLLLHSVTSPPSSEWALTVISQPRLRSRLRARVTGDGSSLLQCHMRPSPRYAIRQTPSSTNNQIIKNRLPPPISVNHWKNKRLFSYISEFGGTS